MTPSHPCVVLTYETERGGNTHLARHVEVLIATFSRLSNPIKAEQLQFWSLWEWTQHGAECITSGVLWPTIAAACPTTNFISSVESNIVSFEAQ
jgi:hypothetical protein